VCTSFNVFAGEVPSTTARREVIAVPVLEANNGDVAFEYME
jgi:hypothetical protein